MAEPPAAPDDATVESVGKLSIFDEKGQNVQLGDLFKDQKTIVVFIRHFFCGMCQAYVTDLATVPQEAFTKAGVKIIIVGCGDWKLISNYKDNSGYTGHIYADPTRKSYELLGLTSGLNLAEPGEKPKSYIKDSVLGNAAASTWRALKTPSHWGKQGNLSQLGGDFVFGPGNHCSWAHRMRNTQDHVEVKELMQAAGVEYTT